VNEHKPRTRFVIGNHVVCISSGRAGQILALTPERGICIVRTARNHEVLTVSETDLRFASWDEVRQAEADQADSGRTNSIA
jgi:hypothetical protein